MFFRATTSLLFNASTIASKARPISQEEFEKALKKAWPPNIKRNGRIGLAISGGVDSMALATLCAERTRCPPLEDNQGNIPSQFQAFVVDHRAREGSDREARAVATQLERMGISSEILTLEWPYPGGKLSPDAPFGENSARKLRFRAFGLACRNHGIDYVLLAHHADDQAENTLMRLVACTHSSPRLCIIDRGGLPESFGIYGVHSPYWHDGGIEENTIRATETRNQDHSLPIDQNIGIQVIRPLLSFRKERLIVTCEANHTFWWEDPTNSDPTLTKRNAIRAIMPRLPQALQTPSLVSFTSRISNRRNEIEAIAQEIFKKNTALLDFNPCAGTAEVRFPASIPYPDAKIPSKGAAHHVASCLIRHVLRLVSPNEDVTSASVESVVLRLFPELARSEPRNLEKLLGEKRFCAGNVLVERIETPLLEAEKEKEKEKEGEGEGEQSQPRSTPKLTTRPQIQFNPKTTYRLSRQPYSNTSLTPPPTHTIPPQPQHYPNHLKNNDPNPDPDPILFDGRFWLTTKNLTPYSLLLRPYQKQDSEQLKDKGGMNGKGEGDLDVSDLLRRFAPGDTRWTIPAIFILLPHTFPSPSPFPSNPTIPETEGETQKKYPNITPNNNTKPSPKTETETSEILLALPSIGWSLPEPELRGVEWRCWFRFVEFGRGRGVGDGKFGTCGGGGGVVEY